MTHLQTGALISEFSDSIEDNVDDLFTDGVVSPGVIVGRVLLARDQLLGMEQSIVLSQTHLVNHCRFKVDKDRARHVLTGASLREKRVERIVTLSNALNTHYFKSLDTVPCPLS